MKSIALTIILLGWIGLSPISAQELFDVQTSNEHFNLGIELYFQKNYREASSEFEKSIRINPDNAKAYYFIGYSNYKDGNFSLASEAFQTAYELNRSYSPMAVTDEVPE